MKIFLMNKKNFNKIIIATIFLLGISFTTHAQVHKTNLLSKSNVVFIPLDDMGWKDLGVYGSTFYETPNIDKLAAQGMLFMDAYASSPVCSPSRSSIMTGQYPVNTGITDWIPGANRYRKSQPDLKLIEQPFVNDVPKSNTSLGQAFKNNGYATCYSGKWRIGESQEYWPENEGFDYNFGGWAAGNPRAGSMNGYFSPYNNPKLIDGPKGEFLTDRLTTEVINFIKKETKEGKPFFADLSFYAVHEPIEAKEEYIKKFTEKAHRLRLDTMQQFVKDADRMQLQPSWKERMVHANPAYAGLIYTVDKNVGRIMATLKELGIDNNTIVVFTSDYGSLSTAEGSPTANYPLRYGKGWNYEGGTRIPLIIKWPGKTAPGTVCDYPVVNTNFYLTFLEMAGLQKMPQQTKYGISMVPLLKGEKSFSQKVIYWHYPHYGNQGGSAAPSIREGDWKLIQFYYDNHVELYNLRTDIEERRDLSKALPERTAALAEQLNL